MNEVSKYQTHLIQLLTGTLAPRQIVGTGYKYPKSVASAWLRKEIHNKQNPFNKVTQLFVQTNGAPFVSQKKAKSSKIYQQLVEDSFKLTSRNLVISDFGIIPTPTNGIDDGYCVFIKTTAAKEIHR